MLDDVSMSAVPAPRPRARRSRLLIIVAALVPLILVTSCVFVIRPGPLWLSRTLGFCPVDKLHTSPSGDNKIRVLITDGGATGYGGIFVYRRSGLRRHDLLWQDAKVVAIPDTHSVRWNAEDEIELSYTKPTTGRVVKTLSIN